MKDMTKYIDDLTEQLIEFHRLQHSRARRDRNEFYRHVRAVLHESKKLNEMKADTLGGIVGQIGHLETRTWSPVILLQEVDIAPPWNGKEVMVSIAAIFLAHVIVDRLDPRQPNQHLKPSRWLDTSAEAGQ